MAFQGRGVTQETSFFPLGGGMDLVTPAIALQPGLVTAILNYEPVQGGYRRLRGFERYVGNSSRSQAFGNFSMGILSRRVATLSLLFRHLEIRTTNQASR